MTTAVGLLPLCGLGDTSYWRFREHIIYLWFSKFSRLLQYLSQIQHTRNVVSGVRKFHADIEHMVHKTYVTCFLRENHIKSSVAIGRMRTAGI